jgi:hypothetical protein
MRRPRSAVARPAVPECKAFDRGEKELGEMQGYADGRDEPDRQDGDHDAGGPALADKRDREVRFRSVAETNAAIVDLTGQRREICRILRSVDAAADLVLSSRLTLTCSRPLSSISASSEIGGTCRRSRRASSWRDSGLLPLQARWVIQFNWASMPRTKSAMRAAAASAWTR